MAGINVDGGGGGRRSLDSELNRLPMIDLLMVTISFLLITAVWSGMARTFRDRPAPELAIAITEEWNAMGGHRATSDRALDQAILHTDDTTEYYKIVAVIDAIYRTKRPLLVGGTVSPVPAFNVTFSLN